MGNQRRIIKNASLDSSGPVRDKSFYYISFKKIQNLILPLGGHVFVSAMYSMKVNVRINAEAT